MKKPRIFKGADGWAVERPTVGFHAVEVRSGFPSREAAGEWLESLKKDKPTGGSFDRTYTPEGEYHRGHQVWPVIVR